MRTFRRRTARPGSDIDDMKTIILIKNGPNTSRKRVGGHFWEGVMFICWKYLVDVINTNVDVIHVTQSGWNILDSDRSDSKRCYVIKLVASR